MDKFLKSLFSKLQKKKGRKNKRNKYLLPKKIIIAVTATIFLIVVVLFSTNIDQILKFFGVRADQATIELSLDPEGSFENGTAGDPPYDSAQDAGPGDTLVWEINVKSIWGTHPTNGETQPFKGTVKFIPPNFSGTPYESFIESVRIEVPEHPDNTGSYDINYPGITITDSSGNCPPISPFPCNWRPVPDDQEFVDPPVKLIIQIADYDPELGGFSIDFEVGAELEYNPYMNSMSIPDPDNPAGIIPPPAPAGGTINLDGPLPEPDFTLEIVSPEATLPEDIHELTVDGGNSAVYIIEINPNEYFGIAGDGIIDLSVPALVPLVGDGLPIASYNFLPESPLTGITGNIEDTDQVYVTLTIYTNATNIQHSIDFDIIGYSDQTDSYIQLGWPPITEPYPNPYPYEMTRRDNARLIIDPTPSYTIDITEKKYALPGGNLNYTIILRSFNDLSGDITLNLENVDPLIDTWTLDNRIDPPVTETAVIVTLPANGTITADLTATLVADAGWQGNYNVDGFIVATFPNTPIIPPPYPEVHGFFGVWDFDVFVTPEPLDVNPIPPAGTANYLITVERYGMDPNDPSVTFTNDVYWGDIRLEAYVKGTLTLLGDDDAIASATIADPTLTILDPYITNAVGEIIIIQTTNLEVIAEDAVNLPEVITIVDFEVFGITTHISHSIDADLTRSDDSRVIIQKTAYFTINIVDVQPRTIPGGQTEFDVDIKFFNNYPNSIELTADISHISIDSYEFNANGIDTPLIISPADTTVRLYLDTNDMAVAEIIDVDVVGRDIVNNNTETKPASVQIVDFDIMITIPLFDGTAHTREVVSGDESTTYEFNVTRLNNLTEDITLSAKLDEISLLDLSSHSSIASVKFTGVDVVEEIPGEYILKDTDSVAPQEVTMTVFFNNPIPTEEINFHIYGDTVVEGDLWQKRSNLARINIDNNYDFRITIDGPYTVAPTGMAEYTITGEWQFGFEENIDIDNAYLSTGGIPSGNLLSSNPNINNLIGFPDGKVLTLANPTIRMQVTAETSAVGEDISFIVHGTANLDSTSIRDRYTNETNIKIIDFEIVSISPTTDNHRTVGPTAELVTYIITLRSTGSTDFDELINLSTNINIIDDDATHYDIINSIDFPITVTNVTSSGITITLRVQTRNIPNDTIPDHSINPFTVTATSFVGSVDLSDEINSALWFENNPYFTLEVTPKIGYSFPGDTAVFDINVTRHYGHNNTINLSISASWPSFINSGNIYFEIQDSTNPNIWYRRDYMNPDETIGKLFIPINNELLGVSVALNNEIEFTVTGNLGQLDSASDSAKLRVKDFNIRVELKNPPHSNNEVYPNGQIVYNVILTRYNTYLEFTEDISLSNVFTESNHTDYIVDPVSFENNGIFYALSNDNDGDIIEETLEMYINTNSNTDNLPQTFNFNVTATGKETGLARTAGNRLVIVEAPDFELTIAPKDGIFSGIPTETVTYIITLTRHGTAFTEDITVYYDTDLNSLYYDSITWQDGSNVFSGSTTQKELYVKFADQEGYTGDHLISVSGTSASFPVPKPSNSTLLRLMDFGITVVDNPDIKPLTPNSHDTWTINLTRHNHYDRAVEVRLDWIDDPLPNIDTWGFDLINDTFPAQAENDTAFLTIYTTGDKTERIIMFNVIGKDIPSELERNDIGGVNIISAPYYELTLTPIVNRGIETETLSYTVEITWLNGFNDPVDLEVVLSDSTDITSYLGKTTLTTDGDTTILYLDLGSGINYGTRTVNVTGNDNGSVGEIPATNQDVIIMDFEIRLNPNNHLISDTAPNNVAVYTVELYRYEGYDRDVTLTTDLSLENYGDILSSSEFENNGLVEYTGQEMDTLNLTVVAKSAASEFGFSVTGTDQFTASVQRSTTGTLTIVVGTTPSFIINIAPNSREISPGGTTTYTVTAQRNNFDETITLTHNLYEIDDRVEFAEFNTNQLVNEGDEAILTVVAKVDANSEDSYRTFNVDGNGGGLQDSDSAELKIYEAPYTPSGGGGETLSQDFSITVEPDEQTVMAGDTTIYIVIINRTNFTGDILLNNTIADNPNIKSAILDQTLIDNETDTVTLTVITETDAEVSTVLIIIDGTAIIDRRETERNGEAILYIRREETIEEIIVPEEELPSTGPELTWLLLGLATLLMTTITYKQLQFNFEYKENK